MEHEENPPSPTANKVSVQLNELRFFSNFDSGNLAGVAECPSLLGSLPSYSLSIGADCEGTPHVNQYMMWYYFGIEGGSPGQSIVLRIEKLNAASKVYNKDLRPLFRTKLRTTWTRLQEPCTYAVIEGSIRLTFRFTFDASGIAYFAYYYPFPHAEHLQLLERFDKVYGHGPNWASRGKWRASHRPKQRIVKDLYFRKELLSHTLDGHPVHLLTISSTKGLQSELEPPIDGLFPSGAPRCNMFNGKPGVYISARVHPGETSSSYLFYGLLSFLLHPTHPVAVELRNRFVFKLIPILNPDGVVRGHFRTDPFGMNLNRAYTSPDPVLHPSIHGAKMVLRQMKALLSSPSWERKGNPLWFFLDLHAYSARSGVYLLGNTQPPKKVAEGILFAQLIHMYEPLFNAAGSSFGRGKNRVRGAATPGEQAEGNAEEEEEGDEGNGGASTRGMTPRVSQEDAEAVAELLSKEREQSEIFGEGHTDLSSSESNKLLKLWTGLKSKTVGKSEGAKDGTARVCIYKDLGVGHSYTVECSCNLPSQLPLKASTPSLVAPLRHGDTSRISGVLRGSPVWSQIIDGLPKQDRAICLTSLALGSAGMTDMGSLMSEMKWDEASEPLAEASSPNPPAVFASAGKAMCMALYELSGGKEGPPGGHLPHMAGLKPKDSGFRSAIEDSEWESLHHLRVWCQKRAGVTPSLRSRAPVLASEARNKAYAARRARQRSVPNLNTAPTTNSHFASRSQNNIAIPAIPPKTSTTQGSEEGGAMTATSPIARTAAPVTKSLASAGRRAIGPVLLPSATTPVFASPQSAKGGTPKSTTSPASPARGVTKVLPASPGPPRVETNLTSFTSFSYTDDDCDEAVEFEDASDAYSSEEDLTSPINETLGPGSRVSPGTSAAIAAPPAPAPSPLHLPSPNRAPPSFGLKLSSSDLKSIRVITSSSMLNTPPHSEGAVRVQPVVATTSGSRTSKAQDKEISGGSVASVKSSKKVTKPQKVRLHSARRSRQHARRRQQETEERAATSASLTKNSPKARPARVRSKATMNGTEPAASTSTGPDHSPPPQPEETTFPLPKDRVPATPFAASMRAKSKSKKFKGNSSTSFSPRVLWKSNDLKQSPEGTPPRPATESSTYRHRAWSMKSDIDTGRTSVADSLLEEAGLRRASKTSDSSGSPRSGDAGMAYSSSVSAYIGTRTTKTIYGSVSGSTPLARYDRGSKYMYNFTKSSQRSIQGASGSVPSASMRKRLVRSMTSSRIAVGTLSPPPAGLGRSAAQFP